MIHHGEMTAEQHVAVAQALAQYILLPQGDADGEFLAPVVPGIVRNSRSGAPWVTFSQNPESPNAVWFRLMDIRPMPDRDYAGAEIVHDANGRPLGNQIGPLILHRICGKWLAQTINTGCNYACEIIWTGDSVA